MAKCGLSAATINLSGGVDSAVSFALMKHAAALPDSPVKRVVPVAQPIHRHGDQGRLVAAARTALRPLPTPLAAPGVWDLRCLVRWAAIRA
jgi:hypothetical protein